MPWQPKGKSARFREGMGSRTLLLFARPIAAGLVLLASHAGAGADDGQGPQIAAMCASCHGPSGSDRGIPAIAGLDEEKIIKAVRAYRANEQPSHVMHAVALGLTEAELTSVARYLAALGKDATLP